MPNGNQSGFDLTAARQAGYSDDEILAHLTQTRNFDVQSALKSGYSKADIIGYLSSSTPATQGQSSGPNLYTGEGMVGQAQKQSSQALASKVQTVRSVPLSWESVKQAYRDQPTFTHIPGENERAIAEGAPLGVAGMTAIGAAGAPIQAVATRSLAPLLPFLRSAIGGIGGTYLGRPAGRVIAEQFGANPESGARVGGWLGGGIGSTVGAAWMPEFIESKLPWTLRSPQSQQEAVAEFMNKGYKPQISSEQDIAAFMNRGYESQPELGSPENPGWYAKIPTRMPQAPEPEPELGSPENPGFYAKIPTQMPKSAGAVAGAPGASVRANAGIVGPDEAALPVKVTYQSQPADALVGMGRAGDVNAIREIIRNPRGIDLDSAIPNWRYILDPSGPRLPWRNVKR